VLEGYVPTSAALVALTEEVGALDPRPRLKVLADEDIQIAANRLLSAKPPMGSAALRAEALGAGRLRLTGAAATSESANEAVAALRAGVPGLRQVDNAVLLPPALRSRFRQKLAAAGLGQKIRVVAEEPELQLSGSLTADEIQQWEALLLDFTRQFGNVLAINASIGRARPPMPVDVQVIVGGRTPFIVTADGEHVNMGGDINGHTLSAVNNSEVVFEGSKRLRLGR
jgi:type III secretion system YscD/HrpQ family protein